MFAARLPAITAAIQGFISPLSPRAKRLLQIPPFVNNLTGVKAKLLAALADSPHSLLGRTLSSCRTLFSKVRLPVGVLGGLAMVGCGSPDGSNGALRDGHSSGDVADASDSTGGNDGLDATDDGRTDTPGPEVDSGDLGAIDNGDEPPDTVITPDTDIDMGDGDVDTEPDAPDSDGCKKLQPDLTAELLCNKEDDDCDGAIDNYTGSDGQSMIVGDPCLLDLQPGECADGPAFWQCRSDPKQPPECKGSKKIQSPEVCDGIDNDCNGVADTDVPGYGDACQATLGSCSNTGVMVCDAGAKKLVCNATVPSTQPELCDGQDNDCNSEIDDGPDGQSLIQSCSVPGKSDSCAIGQQVCMGAAWTTCVSTQISDDLCDGQDNNCDGQIDEDFLNTGDDCTNGKKGACKTVGEFVCSADGTTTVCNAEAGPAPTAEKCNGFDDNCDGKIDEGLNIGKACTVTTNGCAATGVNQCQPDGSVACSAPAPQGTPEVCDGKDNNCNGQTDEGFASIPEICDGLDNNCNGATDGTDVPGFGAACQATLNQCTNYGVMMCELGAKKLVCDAKKPVATEEVCDGKDNDCDGVIDMPSCSAPPMTCSADPTTATITKGDDLLVNFVTSGAEFLTCGAIVLGVKETNQGNIDFAPTKTQTYQCSVSTGAFTTACPPITITVQ